MKKLIVLLLALAMALSLASCGGGSTPPAASGDGSASAESSAVSSTPAEESTPAESTAPAAEGEAAFTFEKQAEEEIKAEDGTVMMTVISGTPTITIPGNEAAQNAVQEALDAEVKAFEDDCASNAKEAEETYNTVKDSGEGSYDPSMYSYYGELNMRAERCDEQVISVVVDTIVYYGGAHGGDVRYTLNFDTATGKVLTFADLGGDAFVDACKQEILSQADEMQAKEEVFFGDYADNVDGVLQDGTTTDELGTYPASFYFTEEGIVFISGEYVLQPYAAGIIEFTVPYEKVSSVLTQQYLPQ